MWVEIDKSIFEKGAFKALNYIYQILSWYPVGSIPRYNIYIDKERVKHTDNYSKLLDIEHDFENFIDTEFNQFITESTSTAQPDHCISTQKKTNHWSIEEAIPFFQQPVSILVENNKNDAYFVRAIIYHFGDDKAKEHLKNGWICFENAGGCGNVRNFLKGALTVFEDLGSRYNKHVGAYFRGLIVLDSDKEWPTQPDQHTKLKRELSQEDKINNVHVLKKRMIENYMPDEVFGEILNGEHQRVAHKEKTWIQTYLRLTPKQKDYIKMEKNKNTTFADSLFDSISEADRAILKEGFSYPKIKNNLPLLFKHSPQVHKQTLKKRCKSTDINELQTIVDKIIALL